MLCTTEIFGEEGVICIASMDSDVSADDGSALSVQPMEAMSATQENKDRQAIGRVGYIRPLHRAYIENAQMPQSVNIGDSRPDISIGLHRSQL
jgi:hypothetical protein